MRIAKAEPAVMAERMPLAGGENSPVLAFCASSDRAKSASTGVAWSAQKARRSMSGHRPGLVVVALFHVSSRRSLRPRRTRPTTAGG